MNLLDRREGRSWAAVFNSPDQELELRSIQLPAHLVAGEFLVRICCATMCGSDLATLAGKRQEATPCILGHENVGRIEKLGSPESIDLRGQRIKIGDRIVWSVVANCDDCVNCQRGLPQKCVRIRKYGHQKLDADWQLSGGFAEYCHLVVGTKIVIVKPSIPDMVIAPASCATATAAAGLRAAGQIEGRRVLVFGAGLLGLNLCAMAKIGHAESIAVVEPNAERAELALKFGADITFPDVERLDQATTDFDAILEASGAPEAVFACIRRGAVGANIVLMGSVRPSPPVAMDPEWMVRRHLSIHGVHNYHPGDLVAAVNFLETHWESFPFSDVVGKCFDLDQIGESITFANEASVIRVAIRP